MNVNRKNNKRVFEIIIKEIRKDRKEKSLIYILFFITLVLISFLIVFLASKLIMTGYATYLSSQGGYITEVYIEQRYNSSYYYAVYGLALRVSGFDEQISEVGTQGEIERVDVFFDCLASGSGAPILTTNATTIDFDNLVPGNLTLLDQSVGCSGLTQCPSVTFTQNTSLFVNDYNITDVPSIYTYRYDGDQTTFLVGILHDGTNFVYYTKSVGVQRAYNYAKIVNYQIMIPLPNNQTEEFYYFNDPEEECPPGGLGENINSSAWGYTFDDNNNILPNVSVTIAGYTYITGSDGYFNVSFYVVPGTYIIIGSHPDYQVYVGNITVNFTNYSVHHNITMFESLVASATVSPLIHGYVFDENNNIIDEVNVSLGNNQSTSNSAGYYYFKPQVYPGMHGIVAIKEGYDNYYYLLNVSNSSTISHNITMIAAAVNYDFPTGPYTTGPYPTGPYTEQVQQQVVTSRKKGDDYWISTREIVKEVRQNTFVEEKVGLYNLKGSVMNLQFSLSSNLQDFVKIDKSTLSINPNTFTDLVVTIYGTKPLGTYNGTLTVSGDFSQDIPITIYIVEKRSYVEALLMELDIFNKIVRPGDDLKYKLNLQNLLREQGYLVNLRIFVNEMNSTLLYSEDFSEVEIENSLTMLKEINIPKNISEGEYLLNVEADYLDYVSSVTTPFKVSLPIYLYSISGIPLWIIFVIISFFSFILLNVLVYRHYKEKKKRYRIMLDYGTLPRPGDRSVRIGNVAETKVPAYYEIEKLTTHCIVAGATGMGKSISAQVIIEECLINNVAVIVLDPTAQWSGMLRKCTDKRMLSFYPKFGLKPTDAKGFKGNVKQIINPRELIDIGKYMNPGQIQIFSLNKLDPKGIDFFVANFIRQIFRSDPRESPNLKMLLVFDEVHRLLSKFGGSGEGFLQVERSCREFRKWGLGVMLISQVLNDFVGEIKANINTEVQTRTLEETDLERIRVKYGEEFLKSLVRAEVGVAMFQNAEYNRGRPYFINFRPILHNTRRLTDEELAKYNKYNDMVDDIEDQMIQLEKEKIDIFDLKMELKLIKDKIMTGNFSVVDIYLEGLGPRVTKEWEKLGKKPKKRKINLVSEEEVKSAVLEAKKEKEKIIAKEKKVEEKPLVEKKEKDAGDGEKKLDDKSNSVSEEGVLKKDSIEINKNDDKSANENKVNNSRENVENEKKGDDKK
ncbi:DUF87 domain-containing protein [Candidatus Pacearchaeota archaeon]|nr:DUF87 domain-containing protein [Candidatus Pacearchaeota archaeon]